MSSGTRKKESTVENLRKAKKDLREMQKDMLMWEQEYLQPRDTSAYTPSTDDLPDTEYSPLSSISLPTKTVPSTARLNTKTMSKTPQSKTDTKTPRPRRNPPRAARPKPKSPPKPKAKPKVAPKPKAKPKAKPKTKAAPKPKKSVTNTKTSSAKKPKKCPSTKFSLNRVGCYTIPIKNGYKIKTVRINKKQLVITTSVIEN